MLAESKNNNDNKCLTNGDFHLFGLDLFKIDERVSHLFLQNPKNSFAWVDFSVKFSSMSRSLLQSSNTLGNENNLWRRQLAYLSIIVILYVIFVCFNSHQSQSQHYPDALGVLFLRIVICNCPGTETIFHTIIGNSTNVPRMNCSLKPSWKCVFLR